MAHTPDCTPLPPALLADVLARLGLPRPPEPSLRGLNALYAAWCEGVPFDNVRKRLALARAEPGPLPGGEAEDFFANWLAHGTGGTCWPSSNGLYALLVSCGFAAERIAASMQDGSDANHGSIVVRMDGDDYLVDSSMLTGTAFPLRRGERYERADPVHPVVVEPLDDTWRVWFGFVMSASTMPCRILEGVVDLPFYLQRYEVSRQLSPFNDMLYARRNTPGGLVSFLGRTRFVKTTAGVEATELDADQLAAALVEDLGLSPTIVAVQRDAGLL